MLCTLAVGAVVYATTKKKDVEPVFDITDKTSVDLFPFEKSVAVYDTPCASITFFNGDPDAAAAYLTGRVEDIVSANPWLGGWVHRQNGDLKLWYDEKGKDRAPFLFRKYESRDVPLTRNTPYHQIENRLEGKGVMVLKTTKLVETNESIFRVSLVPDLEMPKERFALVVSLSHVGGDSHDFYRLYEMLGVHASIVSLNPIRKHEAIDAAIEMIGKREVTYVDEATRGHIWESKGKNDLVTLIFVVSDEWIGGQRLMWSPKVKKTWTTWLDRTKAKTGEAAKSQDQCCGWFGSPAASRKGAVTDGPDEAKGATIPVSTKVAVRPRQPRQSILMAFLNPKPPPPLSPHEILASWFWRTVKPTVGLIPHDFRGMLPVLTDVDAGHYTYAVPFMDNDYKTPLLIRDSLERGRRVGVGSSGAYTSLPLLGLDATFSICPDYGVLLEDDLDLGGGSRQELHLPLYTTEGLSVIPPKVSTLISFSPGGATGNVGAFVVAPKSKVEEIESSGVVKEILAKF